MNGDPFEPDNFSRLGTFKGAYCDDDSVEIGSDDLNPAPQRRHSSLPQDAQARWISIVVVAPFAIALIVVIAFIISRF